LSGSLAPPPKRGRRNVTFEVDWEALIMQEIGNQKCTRKEVAHTYSVLLRSHPAPRFAPINKAIVDRWSLSGLEYIKELAWKTAERRA